jgi:hypothetical protein
MAGIWIYCEYLYEAVRVSFEGPEYGISVYETAFHG